MSHPSWRALLSLLARRPVAHFCLYFPSAIPLSKEINYGRVANMIISHVGCIFDRDNPPSQICPFDDFGVEFYG
jgi:hypothetical protein